jgi:hypothetical protein
MNQELVKCLMMDEQIRSRLTFSDDTKIRLSPELSQLQLKSQGIDPFTGNEYYSTDTDLTVTIAPTNPETLYRWIGFDVEPTPSAQPTGTSVRFKLNDGTSDYYWDGAQWSAAGATDWNDQQTVVENIATFASETLSQQLGLVINLVTTDRFVTPTIKYIDLLMECRIDYLRSLVADSVLPSLREGLRVRVDFVVRAAGGLNISLADLETAFNLVSVEAVFNHDSDPLHLVDLLDSYDATSKIITATTAFTRGDRVWIEFLAEPEIYLNFSSQDYTEVEKLPAAVVDSFSIAGNEVFGEASVRDISTMQATVRRWPFRLALTFEILLLAEKNRTLLAMMDRALAHFASTPLLNWRALDESVSMQMVDEGSFTPRPSLDDQHQSGFTVRIDDLFLWLRPAEVLPLVQQLNITLSSPELQGGSRYSGVKNGQPC